MLRLSKLTDAEKFPQRCVEIENHVRRHNPAQFHEKLIALLRPAVALETRPANDAQIPIGASKFGGVPDVPKDFEWPMWNEEPLPFLVQINLEEVAAYDFQGLLPQTGLLSFFFAWEDWSGSAEDDCRIFWFDSPLVRATSTTNSPKASPSFAIAMEGYLDLQVPLRPTEGWTQEDIDELWKQPNISYESLPPKEKIVLPRAMNKILGYGHDMYGGPISSFFYYEYEDHHSPWYLLLQLFLPEFPGGAVDFGAAEILYFSIRPDDLKERRFHKAQFEVGAS